jgi:hypothetical protein
LLFFSGFFFFAAFFFAAMVAILWLELIRRLGFEFRADGFDFLGLVAP